MIKNIFLLFSFMLALASCGNKVVDASDQSSKESMSLADANKGTNGWTASYDSIPPTDIPDNVIKLIGQDWMLVTSGNKDSFNTMTASWGGLGFLWERPVSFIFIRDSRFTYEFLQKEESFTLSFFTEEFRGALRICGTKSGRDTDKVKESGLTPISTPTGLMTFSEARMVIECKKMFIESIDTNSFVESYKQTLINDFYKGDPVKHNMFISEITNVWIKK